VRQHEVMRDLLSKHDDYLPMQAARRVIARRADRHITPATRHRA